MVVHEVGDLVSGLPEGLVARDEVRLVIQLHEHAGAAVRRRERDDLALGSRASRALLGLGDALLAQPLDGLLDVALVFLEGFLALHHSRAGALAQVCNILGGERSHFSSILGCGVGTPPGWPAAAECLPVRCGDARAFRVDQAYSASFGAASGASASASVPFPCAAIASGFPRPR